MLLSVLAQSNSLLGALLGGTVLVEVIFGVPGLGRTMVLAIVEDESFMALTLALLYTLILILLNLLIDLSSAWFDPNRHCQMRTSSACTVNPLHTRTVKRRRLHLAPRRLIKRFARHHPTPAFWGCVVMILLVAAIAAPWLSLYDPLQTNFKRLAHPPDAQHYMGTDQLGRDILSRVLHGLSHALTIAIMAVLIGTATGALWSYVSVLDKRFDRINQVFLATLQSFPALILALAITAVWGMGTGIVVVAIALTCLPSASRPLHTVPYLIVAAVHLRDAIILAASLDFLGRGTPLPTPTLCNLLADALALPVPLWWFVLFPGCAMTIHCQPYRIPEIGTSLTHLE
jgi:peptide/nickel transport system permease protein